jgi:hypothetical protein
MKFEDRNNTVISNKILKNIYIAQKFSRDLRIIFKDSDSIALFYDSELSCESDLQKINKIL